MSEDYSQFDFVDENDEKEAKKRFLKFSSTDPFPVEIPPALLNSGDIEDYARITSMIFPFDKNKLKSASYEIDFLGDVYYVNEETGKVEKETLAKGEPFTLRKNVIVFIFTKTKFFLPDYIAIRFNLKITHVHRGLLLGTGPLVDPGFAGQLLIPLHNLTSEDYILHGGDGLIWVEFTKLSPHIKWNSSARSGAEYRSFPTNKQSLPAYEYFKKASSGRPASSSIPGEIANANKFIETTKTIGKVVGGLGLVGFLALIYMTWDLISNANQNIATARDEITSFSKDQTELNKRLNFLEAQIKSLVGSSKKESKGLTTENLDLNSQITSSENEL
ncbi:hypothetical protein W03_24220 [Nitrosomonas sp. PY1]|uniref:hypothetical protein n=1 Tax=Nitrosomonas sp. PY1 TaxID=1803906 RepID=UPI001FC7C66B|nr:hypothetical protein [Nitrosomonas sp. PY1]GKS70418.1 hypothetical protein W03_24220 [Nitrosomonas sp. PY1]